MLRRSSYEDIKPKWHIRPMLWAVEDTLKTLENESGWDGFAFESEMIAVWQEDTEARQQAIHLTSFRSKASVTIFT